MSTYANANENADSDSIDTPRFSSATSEGEITNKGGYHQPGSSGFARRGRGCGCTKTTPKGAYRDVTVELPDGRTAHFYHQSAVVVEKDGRYKISSHGYRTSTTKERINRYIPRGYRVIQRDWDWYVTTPDGDRVEFSDGMILPVGGDGQ